MDMKEMLKSGGMTAEELRADFEEQLARAQKELEEEARVSQQLREEDIAWARDNVADAFLYYLKTLDFFGEDENVDKYKDDLVKILAETESQYKDLKYIIKLFDKYAAKDASSDDEILAAFLKNVIGH